MAILSDYEEEDKKKTVAPPSSLDPSDPLGYLEKIFEFVAKESDLFKSDSLVNDVNVAVRMVKDKVEAEDKKGKEVNAEENGMVETTSLPAVERVDLKSKKVEKEKERIGDVEEKNGPREIFPYYSKLKHETGCNFRPYTCTCAGSECLVTGDIPYLVSHLRDDHKVDMRAGCTFNHRYVKSNPCEVENATWMLTE